MNRSALCAALLTLVASNAASAKKESAPSAAWDPAATADLKATNEKMFADIDAGNMDALTSRMSADAVVFDTDMTGKPMATHGSAEIKKTMDAMAMEMKASGGTSKTTIVRDDCFATAVMGYCAVEFDQTFTAGGNTMGPMKFRGTLVARKVDGQWTFDHWHGASREAPPMPEATTTTTTTTTAPPPATPPAPAKK
jgi:ketosteroid isomerase-like protein